MLTSPDAPSTPPFYSSSSTDSTDSNASSSSAVSLDTLQFLDSLHNFYEHEQAWVYRTRAAMELEHFQAPLDVNPISLTTLPPSASSSSSSSPSPALPSRQRRRNTHSGRADPSFASADVDEDTQNRASTRWHQRKNGFQLRLEGLSPHSHLRKKRKEEPGTQLLEQFGELMDSRMESCLRVKKLVRQANQSTPPLPPPPQQW